MTTQKFTLTTTPQQILDGTKAAYIQELRGKYTKFVVSSIPVTVATDGSHTILNNDISVPAGFPIYAWTKDATIELIVSTSE